MSASVQKSAHVLSKYRIWEHISGGVGVWAMGRCHRTAAARYEAPRGLAQALDTADVNNFDKSAWAVIVPELQNLERVSPVVFQKGCPTQAYSNTLLKRVNGKEIRNFCSKRLPDVLPLSCRKRKRHLFKKGHSKTYSF